MSDLVISATVVTEDHALAARAIATLACAAAELALEGLNVSVSAGKVETEDDA